MFSFPPSVPARLPAPAFATCGLVLAMAVLAMGTVPAGAEQDPAPAPHSCEQVSVLDGNGKAIFGIEDMALDTGNDRLILSAYDRFAVAEAMEAGLPAPGGGLYSLPLEAVAAASASRSVTASKLEIRGVEWPLHPHGIGLLDDGTTSRLAVISRLSDAHDSSAADLLLFDVAGDVLTLRARGEGEAYCRANDVALIDPDTAVFTFDQSRCGSWGVWVERVFQPRSSGLRIARFGEEAVTSQTVVDDVAFANGVVVGPDGETVLMTASRSRLLRTYELDGLLAGESTPVRDLSFDGGPDNVSLTKDGKSVTAVHPDPFALFLHINKWGVLPGSRVVIATPDGEDRLVIDDTHGDLPGAATSAVAVDDLIVVSSAWDAGLGICRQIPSHADLDQTDGG